MKMIAQTQKGPDEQIPSMGCNINGLINVFSSTRNFPPDIGGMQNLMEGLSNALLKSWACKSFC